MNTIIFIYIHQDKNFHISSKQKGGEYFRLIEYVYNSSQLYNKIKVLVQIYPEKYVSWINLLTYSSNKKLLKHFSIEDAKEIFNMNFNNYKQLKLF
jgi:hypothetical protein